MKTLTNLTLTLVAALMALALTACGQPQNMGQAVYSSNDGNIVGGTAVKASEVFAKSTVGLASKKFGIFCTASVIADNLIVTAAHCADVQKELEPDDEMIVVFNRNIRVKKLTVRVVSALKINPEWASRQNLSKDTGDVAVLKFEGGLPKGYVPATLLKDKSLLQNGVDVVLAGYGVLSMVPSIEANELMKATVQLSDKDYSDSEVLFKQYKGRGACHGDSGGPAYVKLDNKWVLFGVTSRAATTAGGSTCMEGSIYTDLAAHTDFIAKASEELNQLSPSFASR